MFEKLKRSMIAGTTVALITAFSLPCMAQQVKIGIQAYKGADVAAREWKPTADYLSAKLGKTFTIVPLTDKELMQQVKDGKVDFFFSNPSIYSELNAQDQAQAIATMVKLSKEQRTDQVASSILVRRDSPITKLADFKGKEFMTRATTSFAGWLIVKRLFLEKGINPDSDFKSVQVTKSVQHVVYAVLNGAVDGGAVIAGTLEEMAQDGKIKLEDFRVINKASDNFPFAHSTQLYPEFPMVAVAHTPADLREEVAKALQALTPSDPASVAAETAGWSPPLDYSPVVDCMRVVQQGTMAKKD